MTTQREAVVLAKSHHRQALGLKEMCEHWHRNKFDPDVLTFNLRKFYEHKAMYLLYRNLARGPDY